MSKNKKAAYTTVTLQTVGRLLALGFVAEGLQVPSNRKARRAYRSNHNTPSTPLPIHYPFRKDIK